MTEKKVKQVCKCEHCGNESEMVITCTLDSEENEESSPQAAAQPSTEPQHTHHRVKGHAVCTHCGNEADMWVDI